MESANRSNNKNSNQDHKHAKDFMSQEDIQKNLEKRIRNNLRSLAKKTILVGAKEIRVEDKEGDPLPWIEPDERSSAGQSRHDFTYGHMEPLDKDKRYTCNNLTDKWFEWFLKTPAVISAFTNPSQSYQEKSLLGGRNSFLFQDKGLSIYFAAASPFQEPDIRTITMLYQVPLLVPVFTMSASRQDHPSINRDEELKELIMKDLSGIIQIRAWFDREPVIGCCVIRERYLNVPNIPVDNVIGIPEDRLLRSNQSIETCHGGFWLLIRENKLTPGDHLLEFLAYAKNYEMHTKMLINVLV